MNITFISNYLTHHQKPFCDRMASLLGDGFTFVATVPVEQERLSMGWKQETGAYLLRAYESDEQQKKAQRLIDDADIAIIGSAPDHLIVPRLKAKKITFKYAERFYKHGLNWKTFPRAVVGSWLHHGRFQKYPIYLLCASAYTAADAAVFGSYRGRTYRWGYFPLVKRHSTHALMAKKQLEDGWVSILWAGRLIPWKHPEAAIYLADTLKEQGYRFRLSLIGSGVMESQLRAIIQEKGLEDRVALLGALSPEQVRCHMEQAEIYLFTSDFHEGWGAVLNEAMNSGCAVVASHAIGAVPFLIQDGANGLIYQNGNQAQLEQQVRQLLEDAPYRRRLGEEAYRTMLEEWNPEVAAGRLLRLGQALLDGQEPSRLFARGPCSQAPILKNHWYSRK